MGDKSIYGYIIEVTTVSNGSSVPPGPLRSVQSVQSVSSKYPSSGQDLRHCPLAAILYGLGVAHRVLSPLYL